MFSLSYSRLLFLFTGVGYALGACFPVLFMFGSAPVRSRYYFIWREGTGAFTYVLFQINYPLRNLFIPDIRPDEIDAGTD